jgi:hypothetical protein
VAADDDKPKDDTAPDDSTVGYGKPPKHTQFKKGQSGNRKGRPKGSLNLSTYIEMELNEKVTINENGGRRRILKKQAVAKQVVNKAAGGDPKAIPILLNNERQRESATAASLGTPLTLPEEDQRVMRSLLERIRQSEPRAEQAPTEAVLASPEENHNSEEELS